MSPLAATSRGSDDDNNDEGTQAAASDPLLSRRELLIPALLSLGSGIAILTNGVRDGRAYDAEHKALFAAIEVCICVYVCRLIYYTHYNAAVYVRHHRLLSNKPKHMPTDTTT